MAWLSDSRAEAIDEWTQGIAQADKIGTRFTRARILLEMAVRTGNEANMPYVRSELGACGARGELMLLDRRIACARHAATASASGWCN
jgi:hypothetical protein